ncbi:hypothetical protein SYNPS1DRAFT_30098 [Syncephalis pseudoplumigaleata]|uniref:Protein kinase domain-containing protein n=1 Tax=Syncephalis pseudoplumigaleata TaxID=1712513 RepID=A0A4P9YWB7_9FUNG|nr:hypothetical protein SYNPS1DRAFT_30098 [Syncephalis pseudoplumigaleata]|eukprot:RKP24135.1 hypothetical protein SYNPS1DRAFT_30098 [Syncephalis pseudoplumigaleata]
MLTYAVSTPPSSSRVVGHYALGKEIGSGAYGRVFKGASRKAGQAVAVKEARRCAEGVKEWALMTTVAGHPHIVRAIALDERRTHVFYVLEFAHDGDLLLNGHFPLAVGGPPRTVEGTQRSRCTKEVQDGKRPRLG